ncbi:MAG TPA: M48 family metallopeptidase [Longimicrobiales bacterium]
MLPTLPRTRRMTALGLVLIGTGTTACSISRSEEIQLGRRYAAQINRELPIVEDAAVNRYINLLGDRIARQGERRLDYSFYVVNIDAVNAFAIPGGFIYINRGLIEETDNLAELAGVIAHEVGHVEERHSVEQIERMQRANLGLSLAYILLGRAPGGLERAAIQVGGAAIFASYSREAESEADFVAIPLLVAAGINPTGLLTFFKDLLEQRERRPGVIEQWFSTHPLTEDRIAATQAEIREIPETTLRDLIVNTEQYEEMKARLRRYPPPPPEFRVER